MRWENPVDRVPETRNCDQQVHWLSSLPIHGEIVQDKFVAHLESRVEFVCVCPEAEWVVPVPERGLTISPDGSTLTLEMQNVPVVDQPRWQALDSVATPAKMTFKMVWKSTGDRVAYDDPS